MKILFLFSLILLLSGCRYEAASGDFPIESPLQNICQSGDILEGFPKCR